jgi:hypothetical protein
LSSHGANFNGNHPYGQAEKGPYLNGTVPVGRYPANSFAAVDCHGQAWEWMGNVYNVYSGSIRKQKRIESDTENRCVRGALGSPRPRVPAARTVSGSITGTSILVFVSPGPGNHVPSTPFAHFPCDLLFPLRFRDKCDSLGFKLLATRAAWLAYLKIGIRRWVDVEVFTHSRSSRIRGAAAFPACKASSISLA